MNQIGMFEVLEDGTFAKKGETVYDAYWQRPGIVCVLFYDNGDRALCLLKPYITSSGDSSWKQRQPAVEDMFAQTVQHLRPLNAEAERILSLVCA